MRNTIAIVFGAAISLASAEPSGNYLTWMGYNAGDGATAEYSQFIGACSGLGSTAISRCDIFGVHAASGSSNMTSCNVFGFRAFSGSSFASNVVAIGRCAGRDTTGMTNCVFIGDNAGRGVRGVSNRTQINGQLYIDGKSRSFAVRPFPGSDDGALVSTNGNLYFSSIRVPNILELNEMVKFGANGNVDAGSQSYLGGRMNFVNGMGNAASGVAAHSEGAYSIAQGDYSHAEGRGTETVGTASHAEGWSTTAVGNYSHADGYKAQANEDFTYVWQGVTNSNYYLSHGQGTYNINPIGGAEGVWIGNTNLAQTVRNFAPVKTNDLARYSTKAETGTVVTNVVRSVSGGIWDSTLEVWWTPRMENGSLTYYATTNVNMAVVE